MPLRRPDVELAALADQRLGLVGPHPGGVDDLLGADLERAAGLEVVHPAPMTRSPSRRKPDHPGAGRDVRAVRRRGAGEEHGVPGVVDLRVVVLQRADQGVLAQRRDDRAARRGGSGGGGGARPGRPDSSASASYSATPGAGVGALPARVLQRVEERHRPDQVRREPCRSAARAPAAPRRPAAKSSISR